VISLQTLLAHLRRLSKYQSLIHSLGELIIFAESFGCLEGGVAARSKMNQIAICHNWTSKSSEQNSETLEL